MGQPRENQPLIIYLVVSDKVISSVLVQETDKGEKPVYFVRKVLKWAELRYEKIECFTLVVVIISRKLWYYFQGHPIVVKTNYLIKQVLKKSDLAGRMVA